MWLRPASSPGILGLPVRSSRRRFIRVSAALGLLAGLHRSRNCRIVRLSEPTDHQIDESPGFEFQPAHQFSIPLHILTNGTTDQPRIEHALLGLAIQFEETPQ